MYEQLGHGSGKYSIGSINNARSESEKLMKYIAIAQDQAFLDRVDIKQFIPYLSNRAIYGIYKECLEELSRCGIIEGTSFDVVQVNPENPQTALQYVEQATEILLLPTFDEMLLNYQMFPDAVPKQLGDAALESMVSNKCPFSFLSQ